MQKHDRYVTERIIYEFFAKPILFVIFVVTIFSLRDRLKLYYKTHFAWVVPSVVSSPSSKESIEAQEIITMYESYTKTQSSSPRSPHELMAFRHSQDPNFHSTYTMHAGQYSPDRYQMSDPVSSDDDSWMKEEEEVNSQRRERPLRREILSFEGASEIHERGYDGLAGVDSSEALGHQLRRQRLAQNPSKKYVPDYMVPHYEDKPSVEPAPAPLSPGPFRRSKMMTTTEYSPSYTPPTYSPTSSSTTSSRLRKPGSKKSRPRDKHVVFSEPVSSPKVKWRK